MAVIGVSKPTVPKQKQSTTWTPSGVTGSAATLPPGMVLQSPHVTNSLVGKKYRSMWTQAVGLPPGTLVEPPSITTALTGGVKKITGHGQPGATIHINVDGEDVATATADIKSGAYVATIAPLPVNSRVTARQVHGGVKSGYTESTGVGNAIVP
jgi:hypothetical protein